MNELSKKIIQKIDKEDIRPYSKWHFLFKRSVIWILFIISILLGSFASGVLIYQIQHTEWNIFSHYNHSVLEFAMLVVPYFWITFLILFSILIFYYFRRTESGYRKNTLLIIIVSVLLSLSGGFAINSLGLSEKVENTIDKRVPFYRGLRQRKRKMWCAPNRGLLGGRIIEIKKRNELLLKDFYDEIWIIDITDARIRNRVKLIVDRRIKLIGNISGEKRFRATEIRPWQRRRHRRFHPLMNNGNKIIRY
jgi:hypothetical protein